ncbi:hypothetical protein ES288_D10G233900v1 [Gossypium darwinii]|uniref:Uncharacterized protein n=1 Tax=Gossypium darwinii TaxID=34276 RepID=A0A5D2B3H9_GOSDA|nr:hypothetical protein ES288_D10G233900v1 [Gossypium darwinii]
MEPLSLLSTRIIWDKFCKSPIEIGIVPEIKERLFNKPISKGIFPEKLLYDKSRKLRLERFPMCEGMEPYNELFRS